MKDILFSALICFLSTLLPSLVSANEGPARSGGGSLFGSTPDDPGVLLNDIRERRSPEERGALFPLTSIRGLHGASDEFDDALYSSTGLKLGLNFNHLFQGVSDSIGGSDKGGITSDMDLVGSWELINRGKPTAGKVVFGLEGRWDYGTTGPQEIGFANLGSIIGTANAFSRYTPTFLLRNLYYEMGSPEAGWGFRVGKITPDAMLATSRHITPLTTFLPNGGTGFFSSGYPDSGLGLAGAWRPTDDIRILGIVSDARGNRFNFGNPGAGDFYTALELGAKIAPKTDQAGYSKLTFWRIPETGMAINGATGKEGWGMTVKHEHEFTDDGRAVGVFRWGRSWDDASVYKQQAGAHFLYYDPGLISEVRNDVIGTAINWVKANDTARDEYNFEVFYRFPFFPGVDTTVSYQSVFDPAFNTEFDHAHVLSFRVRTTF